MGGGDLVTTDPGTKRATRLAVLVVLTVGLPSLVLTGLGAAAVANEEAAAQMRAEELYAPVGISLVERFNAWMEETIRADRSRLKALAMWALTESPPPPPEDPMESLLTQAMTRAWEKLGGASDPSSNGAGPGSAAKSRAWEKIGEVARALSQPWPPPLSKYDRIPYAAATDGPPPALCKALHDTRHAVNFFVIDAAGEVILPRALEPGSETVVQAIEAATPLRGPPRYGPAKRLLRTIRDPEASCALKLSLALKDPRRIHWAALQKRCGAYAPEPGLTALVELLEEAPSADRLEVAETAIAVVRELAQPGSANPAWLATLAARRLYREFDDEHEPASTRARHVLRTVAERAALIRYIAGRNRVFQPQEVTSASVLVDDWRRLVVTGTFDQMVVGYELVPDLVAQEIQGESCEKCLEDSIQFELHPADPPEGWCTCNEEKDEKSVWWAMLRQADLAWSLNLGLRGEQSFWSLSHSRSGLYLWSLVLVGMALVGGIGHTLYAVAREARISRLKTDFVSSVSHDLRTPLTSIRLFTESLLLNRVRNDGERTEYLEVIAQETERLSRLTERILDFSRMEAGRKAYAFEPENVAVLVQHALRSCRPVIDECEGTVSVQISEDLPPIRGDHDALIEVLINLITNAVKYSDGRPDILIRAFQNAETLTLEVSDNGIGIASSDLRRVFEKFHRVDCRRTSEVGGCGIGLSLVKHIVDAHGGTVSVSSQVGVGSTFSIRLPTSGTHPTLEPSFCKESETLA